MELKNKNDQVKKQMTSLTEQSSKVKDLKAAAEKQKVVLTQKTKEIDERKIAVNTDLMKAEPALIAAQQSVSGVSKGNIDELKNFQNPPANVKLALEPVIALILNKTSKPEWPEIKAELKKETFKNTVLNFDKDKIGKKCSAFISNTYLKNEGAYNIDVFFKAS